LLVPNQTLMEMEAEFDKERHGEGGGGGSSSPVPESCGDAKEEKAAKQGVGDWDVLLLFLKDAMAFCDRCMAENRTLLIHDDEGGNFATAFLIVYLCTRKRIRVNDAVAHVAKVRREAVVTEDMALGLKGFQESLDTMKLKRLERRLKNSDVVSVGF